MNSKNVQILINILIIIFEIVGIILIFNEYGSYNLEYYTADSNLLLFFSSVLILIYLLQNRELPSWLKSFRFISVSSITLTLIIVLTVLPLTGRSLYELLFHGSQLYQHVLCPILAIISFSLIERYDNLRTIEGTYFTIVYGIVLILLNALKIVDGPYPFLRVTAQPLWQTVIWMAVIFLISYVISAALKRVNGKALIR